jgi:hypothetical protein
MTKVDNEAQNSKRTQGPTIMTREDLQNRLFQHRKIIIIICGGLTTRKDLQSGLLQHRKIIIIICSGFLLPFSGTKTCFFELMHKKAMLHRWCVAESNKSSCNADYFIQSVGKEG